ncbi:MAG: NADH-quinone oxidoreductase subunit C [Candidatus Izimaplasma sp.]|nr:NADH-quinone oxidoreductase subunit C [Candidatus Izimaplasma bacterium]
MNSMNNVTTIKELVTKKITVLKEEVIDQYQVSFEVKKDDVHHLLSVLKQAGWRQLSYLSAVDWIEDNEFELVYIVFNWEKPVHIQIRCRIDRNAPTMDTILPIYPGAKYYEREAHEFFGIAFPGNDSHEKQLILENWDDIPPLRKDFDPKAYSDARFPKREYSNDHVEMNGQKESKQAKREERRTHILDLIKGGKK